MYGIFRGVLSAGRISDEEDLTVKTISLGESTLRCTRIAYGCWRLAGTWDSTHVSPEREAQGRAAVHAAFEAGYTLFDHADIYCNGMTEAIFGQALKEAPGVRDQILIATKCGIRRAGDPTPQAPYRYDFSSAHMIESCERSLKRLGIETIDLYLLHRPDVLCDPAEVASAFSRLRKAGKVREFGVSNFSPSQVAMLNKACPMPLAVNQVEISLCQVDAFENGTLDQCLAEKITPQAWSPLGGGRIADGVVVSMDEPNHARRIKLLDTLDSIARERQTNRSNLALAWLLKHPARIQPIIGSTNKEHIHDCIKADDIELSREEWYRLYEAAVGQRLP